MTLDIITVCRNSLEALKLTAQSVKNLAADNENIRWIIVDGDSNDGTKEYLKTVDIKQLIIISEKDNGIYDAMNKGLSVVKSDYFVFINAGDYILGDLYCTLSELSESHVHCFATKWHDSDLRDIRRSSRVIPLIGKMMPHQGMFFPKRFSRVKYDSNLRISADLKMKYYFFDNDHCCVHSEPMVSSLIGGISQRPLSVQEFIERIRENWKAQSETSWVRRYATLLYLLFSLVRRIRYRVYAP